MKKLLTLLMTALFSLSMASFVLAQDATKDAPKTEIKDEQKTEKKEKKAKKGHKKSKKSKKGKGQKKADAAK